MEHAEYQKLYELEDSYWWFVGRRGLVDTLIHKWMPDGQVGPILDVGCGTGGNLESLAHWGCETGIDISPLALNYARRRTLPRLAQASGLALPFKSNTFGMVTAFDVLYHRWVTNDDNAVRECYRVLQSGGWLLVMEAALPGLWSHHDEVFYARQRYTLDEMGRMIEGAGFTPLKLSYANTFLLPMALAARRLACGFPSLREMEMQPLPGWLNRVLTSILNLEAIWLRRGTFPVGSTGVCLAQKR